jgi:hypothetical protein
MFSKYIISTLLTLPTSNIGGQNPCFLFMRSRFQLLVAMLTSVGIALGYGLDDRGFRVRFTAGVGNFSLHHRIQNGSGAHLASCPMDTRGSFLGNKAAGA